MDLPLDSLVDGTQSHLTGWVCSYYVHADQVGYWAYANFDGTATFDSAVIGVIIRGTDAGDPPFSGPPYTLHDTDAILGATGTFYPGDAGFARGLEFDDTVHDGGYDTLTVSGTQVSFWLSMGGYHDAFRILVEPIG